MTVTALNTSEQLLVLKAPAASDANIDVDVRELLLMLWRRKLTIIGTMIAGVALLFLVLNFIPQLYTARTIMLLNDPGKLRYSDEIQVFMGNFKFDNSMVLSQIEVLRSRTLAHRIVERLNLVNDPDFNPKLDFLSGVQSEAAGAFKSLSLYGAQSKLPENEAAAMREEVVTQFLKNLGVRSIPASFAVQVEYTSNDPRKAAMIANTVVDVYIEYRLEQKTKAAEKLTTWLDNRLNDLRENMNEAERAVRDYRIENTLMAGIKTSNINEQVSELNSQLILAKAKKAEAEARLKQIESGSGGIESVPGVIGSDLIQRLKLEKVGLEGRLSEMSRRYGERHPEIIKVRAELADLRQTIAAETAKIKASIAGEVDFANERVKAIEKSMNEISGDTSENSEVMLTLKRLERDAETTRQIYDTLLQTYKRANNQQALQEADAEVISYAVVPRAPSYPNIMLFLSLGAAISLFSGLALAILIEKLDNTYRSASHLEDVLGYPCYGLIPAVKKIAAPELGKYPVTHPSAPMAEAIRSLRTVLNLRTATPGQKPKSVMVTSSFPGEGKTTLSLWLARSAAKAGDKVILIDADLRRPSLHRALGRAPDQTLVEYLTGQKELDQVLQKDDVTGMHFILGRSVPNSALDLIGGDKMKKLIASLQKVYDLVIIDSPASLAVSDSRLLSTMVDQTLYAVAWDKTPRQAVRLGVKQFYDMGYKTLSFVMTGVDVRRHVRYGYGDAVYYYGRYQTPQTPAKS